MLPPATSAPDPNAPRLIHDLQQLTDKLRLFHIWFRADCERRYRQPHSNNDDKEIITCPQ